MVGENLRQALFLPLGRRLVTVVCDLPLARRRVARGAARRSARSWSSCFAHRVEELAAEFSGPSRASAAGQRWAPHRPGRPSGSLFAPDRSAYERCSTGRPSSAGWKNQSAPTDRRRHRNHQPRSFAARIVGISLATARARPALPLAHHYPACRHQLPRDEVLAKLKPWLESASTPSSASNLKYDQHVFANHGIALPASPTTRCSNPTSSNRTRARPRPAASPAVSGRHHLVRIAVRQGRQADRLRAGGDRTAAAEYAAEDADVTCACMRRCCRASMRRGRPQSASTARSRCRRARSSGAWSATAS